MTLNSNLTHKNKILDKYLSMKTEQQNLGLEDVLFFFLVFVYFWDRESVNGGGAEREEDIESEVGSRLWAVSTEPDVGLELTNREIMTCAEVAHLTNWATQVPLEDVLLNKTENTESI